MHYYSIILWNKEKQVQVTGLTKAESAFQSEDKGREWAKLWESQGYAFHAACYIDQEMEKLERGETIFIA